MFSGIFFGVGVCGVWKVIFDRKATHIAPIEELNLNVWVAFLQLPNLSVLQMIQSGRLGGELDIEVLFGQVKIGRKCRTQTAIFIVFQWKCRGLVFPGDAVEFEQAGEFSLGGVLEVGFVNFGHARV